MLQKAPPKQKERDKIMKIFKCIFFLVVGFIIEGTLRANEFCQCISVHTTPAPNNKVRWTGTCYTPTGDKSSLGILIVSQEEATKQTERYMRTYQIKRNDCITLPDGTMKYAPRPL